MQIILISSNEKFVFDNVSTVYFAHDLGDFMVCTGHADMVSTLGIGCISFQKRKKFFFYQGIMYIFNQQIFIYSNFIYNLDVMQIDFMLNIQKLKLFIKEYSKQNIDDILKLKLLYYKALLSYLK